MAPNDYKFVCFKSLCGYNPCGVGCPIFIFCILDVLKKTAVKIKDKKDRRRRILILIPCVVNIGTIIDQMSHEFPTIFY